MQDENGLKEWFLHNFKEWFEIYTDVEGIVVKDGSEKKLIADFIILPKQELRDSGINGCLGVEVKYINTEKNFFERVPKSVFQAISYSFSDVKWGIGDKRFKTDAFLIFSNLSFKAERKALLSERCDIFWKATLSVANHADVGELMINKKVNRLSSWYMHFSGANYCSWNVEKGVVLNNQNVIGKRRIGYIG
jgi:hypothetical protein